MEKTLNDYIEIYRKQLEIGDIQIAYEHLIKYVMALKNDFSKECVEKYTVGNVMRGYMDITYFSFYNQFLRDKKLRFGIVLNHKNLGFELWLMGQNAEIQKKFWELTKNSKWNKEKHTMPKYSFLDCVLLENPNFNQLDVLTDEILKNAISISDEILEYLKEVN